MTDPVTDPVTDQPTDSPVLYDAVDGVATIELNRPAASNALDLPLCAALLSAVEAAAQDESVRAVLLLGRGKLFCGGGDVPAMAAAPDRAVFLRDLADAAHEAVLALGRLEKPVVAGVQGAAAGAGFALTLSADLVVAAEWGIATSAVPDDEVTTAARALAEQLAAGPAFAYGQTRALLRASANRSLGDALEEEARTIAAASRAPESQKLISDFVAK